MSVTGSSGSTGSASVAAAFNGKIQSWPEKSLNICNVPIEEKDFIRYIAAEWYKNQSISNPKETALQAIRNAQILYNQLNSLGYI